LRRSKGNLLTWATEGTEGTGKREEGKGKREEGRGKREEGREKREEGRGKKEEGRGKREAYISKAMTPTDHQSAS
jgi:hypothetical protein